MQKEIFRVGVRDELSFYDSACARAQSLKRAHGRMGAAGHTRASAFGVDNRDITPIIPRACFLRRGNAPSLLTPESQC